MTGLSRQVQQTIVANRLLPPGARIVVAVSGGVDSVALLQVLIVLQPSWNFELFIAHLDHGLRRESVQDAAFVGELGARWHLPVTIERRDVAAICAREGWSLEDGARRIRYGVLREVAQCHSATHVALAHTADDQAETVLMRLLRGTGLMGLTAIPITRTLDEEPAQAKRSAQAGVWLVRPLLETWRQDVLAHVERAHLSYREDITNADPRFLRNRIRHELLPLLERNYNPNIKSALVQLAEQSRWDYAYLQAAAGKQWKRITKTRSPSRAKFASSQNGHGAGSEGTDRGVREIAISIAMLLRQPKALQRQLVRQAIRQVRGTIGRWEFRHWEVAEQLFVGRPSGTRVDLPGGIQLFRDRDHVICRATERRPSV
ncbi:MAG: tRNA lysidine(34) synthetase TilS [Candidatus Omnitrophica bacterium]|nr:tRNA lysidine(34) synthetase TilS [Candidatus Omnitrophota bacterium]